MNGCAAIRAVALNVESYLFENEYFDPKYLYIFILINNYKQKYLLQLYVFLKDIFVNKRKFFFFFSLKHTFEFYLTSLPH